MTPREIDAYRAGLKHAADLAIISALQVELRDDAGAIRQQVAAAALRGLAEGLRAEARPADLADTALYRTMEAIASTLETSGIAACPQCSGRLAWIKDDSNGHIHARCEGAGCLIIMQ